MRYIRRYSENKAVVANLTVWRRLAVAGIMAYLASISKSDPMMALLLWLGAIVMCITAAHVAFLKTRTTLWP